LHFVALPIPAAVVRAQRVGKSMRRRGALALVVNSSCAVCRVAVWGVCAVLLLGTRAPVRW
jgi:hypothetical protein